MAVHVSSHGDLHNNHLQFRLAISENFCRPSNSLILHYPLSRWQEAMKRGREASIADNFSGNLKSRTDKQFTVSHACRTNQSGKPAPSKCTCVGVLCGPPGPGSSRALSLGLSLVPPSLLLFLRFFLNEAKPLDSK